MAGSCTITHQNHRSMRYVEWAWTSDSDGNMDQGATTFLVDGHVFRVVTDPGAAAPTDNYDIVINDEDGVDIMAAGLANRDTANTEQVIPDPAPAVSGTLDAVVSNAGNAKAGVIRAYYR